MTAPLNLRFLISKKAEYPVIVTHPRVSTRKVESPIDFSKAHPEIMFCRVPFYSHIVWMFRTQEDSDVFVSWIEHERRLKP